MPVYFAQNTAPGTYRVLYISGMIVGLRLATSQQRQVTVNEMERSRTMESKNAARLFELTDADAGKPENASNLCKLAVSPRRRGSMSEPMRSAHPRR
jgi:hypothetical protein